MKTVDVIKGLETLLILYVKLEQKLKDELNLDSKDIRFNYYRKGISLIDTAIHLLMFSDTGAQDLKHLQQCYKAYSIINIIESYKGLSNPPGQLLFEGCAQFIANEYFTGTYHIFESTFRVLSEFYDQDLYNKKESSIKKIFYNFMEIYMTKTDQFGNLNLCAFEYMRKIRNSIHNDGIFKVDRRDIKEMCDFDGNKIKLEHNKPIEFDDLWNLNLKMTMWSYFVITGIITVPNIESAKFILDPSRT